MPETPEQRARREIDAKLTAAGWIVQDCNDLDLTAGRGIAVREFPMKPGHGYADYLRELKKAASVWCAENHEPAFAWQEGYAAFSVSPTHRDAVGRYIAGQAEHHRKTGFVDELKSLLEKNGVNYDPRYLL